MSDLRDLYQEVILDHSRKPRNFRVLPGEARCADGHNPLCGDRVTVFLDVREGRIEEATFQGNGCASSTASASMMTEALRGKSIDEVDRLFGLFHDLVTGKAALDAETLGKLAAFEGVREFPVRVKCATLPWHTLRAALGRQRTGPVKTE